MRRQWGVDVLHKYLNKYPACQQHDLRPPSRYSASSEQKVAFSRKLKEDFCNKDWRAFKAGLKAFCGGKKKGTGGTPPVHASAAAAAARRQAPPQHPVRARTCVALAADKSCFGLLLALRGKTFMDWHLLVVLLSDDTDGVKCWVGCLSPRLGRR